MPLVSWRGLQSHPRQLTLILTLWSFAMKRILQSGMPVLLLALMSTQAMSFGGNVGILFSISKITLDARAGLDPDRVDRVVSVKKGAEFVISKFDSSIIKEFSNAWRSSGNGMTDVESVVLILRMVNGGFKAFKQGSTNEHRQF